MRGELSDGDILIEIVTYCEYIGKAVAKVDGNYEKFIDADDRMARDACAFYVGQIGEYAGKLTVDFRTAHSEILWRQIINLRNRIFHDYRSTNLEMLWRILTVSIPELKEQCRKILRALDPTAEAAIREELEAETIIYDGSD